MFQNFFQRQTFYFSQKQYDLTLPFVKQAVDDFDHKILKSDSRFFYNEVYISPIADSGFTEFVQPFICGTLEGKQLYISGKSVTFVLLSRRDRMRAGMRFMSRGADLQGNTSNFAETEQIMQVKLDCSFRVYSFLQIRGSIPFLWKQTPSLKWAPKIIIESSKEKNRRAFREHHAILDKNYRSTVMVNLIDKKKQQGAIGEYFSSLYSSTVGETQIGKLVWFDFHKECAKMQWHNLSKLIDEISPSLREHGFSEATVQIHDEKKRVCAVIKNQRGVIRVNCMDCLDRTNVVQSVIARNALLTQLYQSNFGEKPNGNPFESLPHVDLEEVFRDFWTKNADQLSLMYSGTGALKTDFTRTGKRSMMGKIEDGRRSVTRYVLNNFHDTYNQNSLDLVLGKIGWFELKDNQSSQGKIIFPKAILVNFKLILSWSLLPCSLASYSTCSLSDRTPVGCSPSYTWLSQST